MAYANVNGISLGYEVHDAAPGADPAAPPLILLHGGLGTGADFAPHLPEITPHRRAITVDLRGHGRTAGIERGFSFEAMADDVAALIGELDLGPVDLLGYSLGGDVSFQVAARHPGLVRRLVLVSVGLTGDSWFPEVRAAMRAMSPEIAEMMKQAPIYAAYAEVAPRVEAWSQLVTQTGALVSSDYDWRDQVKAITADVMLAYADADSLYPARIIEFYGLLGGGQRDYGWEGSGIPPRSPSRLAVLPGHSHYDMLCPALFTAVNDFLA
ncbi:MAG: alpha/beta fold hydrolase [Actinocrinis sp.]